MDFLSQVAALLPGSRFEELINNSIHTFSHDSNVAIALPTREPSLTFDSIPALDQPGLQYLVHLTFMTAAQNVYQPQHRPESSTRTPSFVIRSGH